MITLVFAADEALVRSLDDQEIRPRLAPLFEQFQWDKDEPGTRAVSTKEDIHA